MKIAVCIMALMLTSCAAHRPVVDTKGIDQYAYERDLRECQNYADGVSPMAHAVGGAAIVGGIAAGLAAIAGIDIGTTAAMGAVLGGVSGLGRGMGTQQATINNCLRGRGYSVLR